MVQPDPDKVKSVSDPEFYYSHEFSSPRPDTQLESWDETRKKLPRNRAAVLAVIERFGGAPLWKVAAELGWPVHWVSGRITELRRLGLVSDSGSRRANPATGKSAVVWILVDRREFDKGPSFL